MHSPYFLDLVTPPSLEPVAVADVVAQARIDPADASADSAYISGLITAARQLCENECDRAFLAQTYALSLECFPYGGGYFNRAIRNNPSIDSWLPSNGGAIPIPRPPLISITSVVYLDPQAIEFTLDPSTYRVVKGSASPTRLLPKPNGIWPTTFPAPGSVVITYQAGYGTDPSSVPGGIKLAIQMLAASWYAQREAFTEGSLSEIPFGVKSILAPFVWGAY